MGAQHRNSALRYPTRRPMRFTAVGFHHESVDMLGSNFGAVDKAVSYILSQPDGKLSRDTAELRRSADSIVSALGFCEKTGGCGGRCSESWRISTEGWRILVLLGVIGCILVEHGPNRLCHIHSPDGHLLAKRRLHDFPSSSHWHRDLACTQLYAHIHMSLSFRGSHLALEKGGL